MLDSDGVDPIVDEPIFCCWVVELTMVDEPEIPLFGFYLILIHTSVRRWVRSRS